MGDGKTKRIALGDINPFIRLSRIHTIEKSFNTGLRLKALAENILRTAVDLYNSNQKFSQEKASLELKEFFIHFADESEDQITSKQTSKNKISILEFINNHCFEDLSNQKIAEVLFTLTE